VEVDDDLRAGCAGPLRLAVGVVEGHRLRHFADEEVHVGAGGGVAVMVAKKVGGRGQDVVQASDFGIVFGGGEGAAVLFDEAGDVTLAGFDLDADHLSLGVDVPDAVLQGGLWVVDLVKLIFYSTLHPDDGCFFRELGRCCLCGDAQAGGDEEHWNEERADLFRYESS